MRQGDVICIIAPNQKFYPIVYLAVLSLGGIITDINPSYRKGDILLKLCQKAYCNKMLENNLIAMSILFMCKVSILNSRLGKPIDNRGGSPAAAGKRNCKGRK